LAEHKYRHEFKYLIDYADYLSIKQRLKAVLKPDKHADADGKYSIRSLYFDNYHNQALMEKIEGVNRREKYRLRYYNHDTSRIRLEKKCKVNGFCTKQTAPISLQECSQILKGDYTCFKNHTNPLLSAFFAAANAHILRPCNLVVYTREPFVYPAGNVRITLDSCIRAGLNPQAFLDSRTPLIATGSDIVLEVKYDAFLPEIISRLIQTNKHQATAYSKYTVCRLI